MPINMDPRGPYLFGPERRVHSHSPKPVGVETDDGLRYGFLAESLGMVSLAVVGAVKAWEKIRDLWSNDGEDYDR